jgi:hypothetical protein
MQLKFQYSMPGALDGSNAALKAVALDRTLDMIGKSSKDALLYHLENHHGIMPGRKEVSLIQLRDALHSIFGESVAELLLEALLIKLDELSSDTLQ